MPAALFLGAHQRYLDIWQQALESEKGIRLKSESPTDLRARLYHARAADRRNNAKIYPADNPLHNRSFYDHLTIRLEEGAVRIESGEIGIQEIEVL